MQTISCDKQLHGKDIQCMKETFGSYTGMPHMNFISLDVIWTTLQLQIQARSQLDNWRRANIYIFVFTVNKNKFQKKLIVQNMNT